MLRRLFALIVLVILVGAAWFLWTSRHGAIDTREAQTMASQKLGRVGATLEDAKVTAQVKTALELNRDLKPYSIHVDTHDNVVTLSGDVARGDLKQAAVRVASAVPDVKDVRDELQVNASATAPAGEGRTVGESFDDRALEAKINLAFSLNRDLKGTDIKVSAFRRDVTLGGTVATPQQRQTALDTARTSPDVNTVTDQIQVGGQPPPGAAGAASNGSAPGAPSAVAAADASRALSANPNLAPYGLRVQQQGSRLVLTGRVKTGAEKDLAVALAQAAAHAPIDNAVEVGP